VYVVSQVLAQNHIQSAPVVNSKTNEVLGMVDMLDIVAFILSVAPSGHQLSVCGPHGSGEASSIAHLSHLQGNALKTMEIAGRAMALETLKNVVGMPTLPPSSRTCLTCCGLSETDFSGRDPYVPITTNSPLTYAATLFRQGIHRLPVVDEHTKAVRVTPSS
jgi:CBS domain-containing protein